MCFSFFLRLWCTVRTHKQKGSNYTVIARYMHFGYLKRVTLSISELGNYFRQRIVIASFPGFFEASIVT